MFKAPSDQPPSPELKRNTAHASDKIPEPALRPEGDKPDEGTRPDQLTTENDDGKG